jgi:hypothetical protein
MTFGSEVYCLDAKGRLKWKRALRPDLTPAAHAYLAPILCDLNGDSRLEILVMTSDGIFRNPATRSAKAHAILFALTAEGEILDRLDLQGPRYFGEAFLANVDDDPQLELVLAGSGGLDVIKTRGYGPDVGYHQRRRSYLRLNVYPWAYEDTYFIERGVRENVTNRTDNLVLQKAADGVSRTGRFLTDLLKLPPGCAFVSLRIDGKTPKGTALVANVLDAENRPLRAGLPLGRHDALRIAQPVRLEFRFESARGRETPLLDSYSLRFDKTP